LRKRLRRISKAQEVAPKKFIEVPSADDEQKEKR
jgi:hypothetical protein